MNSIRTHLVLFAATVLAGVASSTALLAHHSQSQFEPELTISIEGTLTKASWSNPHTLFVIDGKKAGSRDAAQEWTVEGPSPRQLEAKGWGRTVSKAGDRVTFEGRPRRDGQPELLLLSVTLADGKTFSFKPE
jgi:Family of unknown function (DUF6152)